MTEGAKPEAHPATHERNVEVLAEALYDAYWDDLDDGAYERWSDLTDHQSYWRELARKSPVLALMGDWEPGELARLKKALGEIKHIAEGHHSDQAYAALLHSLTVDIPHMVDLALCDDCEACGGVGSTPPEHGPCPYCKGGRVDPGESEARAALSAELDDLDRENEARAEAEHPTPTDDPEADAAWVRALQERLERA